MAHGGNVVTEGQAGYMDEVFAYTGRLLDQTTGLQNNLNRWYDASVGRWLSEDPIGFRGGDANLYRYVGNGPVNGRDPSGLDPAFAPSIGIGSPFYKRDPVLPIDGVMQEPQHIWVCLGTYAGIATITVGGGALLGGGAVGEGAIAFGHGSRHLMGTGLCSTQVEAAIAQHVQSLGPMAGAAWGWVQVNGQWIQYRLHILADGVRNVGTYFPVTGPLAPKGN